MTSYECNDSKILLKDFFDIAENNKFYCKGINYINCPETIFIKCGNRGDTKSVNDIIRNEYKKYKLQKILEIIID